MLLVLGSTSRYRRELLSRLTLPLGIDFSVHSPGVDETPLPQETPKNLALRLSLAKARAVAAQLVGDQLSNDDAESSAKKAANDAIIIGSDQTATIDGIKVIGKPGTHDAARAQLLQASGKSLRFYSGLAVIRPAIGFEEVRCIEIEVQFKTLSPTAIERYLLAEKPYDCTGSAKIESLGIALVKQVHCTDPSALIGLPLIALSEMLETAGLKLLS